VGSPARMPIRICCAVGLEDNEYSQVTKLYERQSRPRAGRSEKQAAVSRPNLI
jgi:hypothetical protein